MSAGDLDQAMAQLRVAYVARLAETRAALAASAAVGDRVACARIAHRLKGSAGSYGFPTLTDVAGACERALEGGDDVATAVAPLLDEIDATRS